MSKMVKFNLNDNTNNKQLHEINLRSNTNNIKDDADMYKLYRNKLIDANSRQELIEISNEIYDLFYNKKLTDTEFSKLEVIYSNLIPSSNLNVTDSNTKKSLNDSLDFLLDSNYKYKKYIIKKSGKLYIVYDNQDNQLAKFNTSAEAESYIDNLNL